METNPDMKERKVFHACQHDCPDNCAMVSTIVDDKVVSVQGRKGILSPWCVVWKVKNYDQRVYSKTGFSTRCSVLVKRDRQI